MWQKLSNEVSESDITKTEDTPRNLTISLRRVQACWSSFLALLSDSWVPEVAAIILNTTCCLAIAILIKVWSGKMVPRLSHGLTPNGIVSVLATTSKSAMMFVVATCSAQQKWIWFRHPRPLGDMQTIDDCSRGPYGASIILLSPGLLSLTTLAATITILSLAFDPVVQQALVYPSLPVSIYSSRAVIGQVLGPVPLVEADSSALLMMNSGSLLTALLTDATALPQPRCDADSCIWHDYRTVEICTRCEAVVPRLVTTWNWTNPTVTLDMGDYGNVSVDLGRIDCTKLERATYDDQSTKLPDNCRFIPNYFLSYSLGSLDKFWTENFWVKLQNGPIAATAFTYLNWETNEGPLLNDTTICMYDFCLQSYEISVNDTKMHTAVKEGNTSFGRRYWRNLRLENQTITPGKNVEIATTCWEPSGSSNIQYSIEKGRSAVVGDYYCPRDPLNLAFCACSTIYAAAPALDTKYLAAYDLTPLMLSTGLEGIIPFEGLDIFILGNDRYITYMHTHNTRIGSPIAMQYDSIVFPNSTTNKLQFWMIDFLPKTLDAKLAQIYYLGPESAARRFSMWLTSQYWAFNASTRNFQGISTTLHPHVQARWSWLLLPALLSLGTMILLIGTMKSTRKHNIPLWKTSIIAALFTAIENDQRPMASGLSRVRVSDLTNEAESLMVKTTSNSYGKIVLEKQD